MTSTLAAHNLKNSTLVAQKSGVYKQLNLWKKDFTLTESYYPEWIADGLQYLTPKTCELYWCQAISTWLYL